MPDGVSIQVHGLRELEEELAKFGPEIAKKVLRKAVKEGAEPMRAEAWQRAPWGEVRGGRKHLKNEILMKVGVKRGKTFIETVFGVEQGSVTAMIGFTKDVFYGMFQELGTRFHAAQPFLRPAFDNNSESFIQIMKTELKKGIEAQAKKAAKRFSRFKRAA